MKTTAFPAFLFFFLLFAYTTTSEGVFDSDGDILRNVGTYYLSSVEPNGNGGIVAAAIRKGESNFCSLALVQALKHKGWPTIILTWLRVALISTDVPLDLSFAYLPPNICTNSTRWFVTRSTSLGKPVMVGDANEFSDAVVEGWFFIKPYNSARRYYKLVFCQVGGNCGNIGPVQVENEAYKRLVVTDGEPVVFKFDKAYKDSFVSDVSMVV